MYSIILSVGTAFNRLWFVHWMCHPKASAGIGAFVLVIYLAPTRFWRRTATTSARLGHGRGGINVADKEKHCSMSNVDFVELNLLDSGGIIVFWNLSLFEENVLDWIRNPDFLDLTTSIDIENGLGWCRLGLNTRLNFGLGRCCWLCSRTNRTAAWRDSRWSWLHYDLSRLRMELLPCGFSFCLYLC